MSVHSAGRASATGGLAAAGAADPAAPPREAGAATPLVPPGIAKAARGVAAAVPFLAVFGLVYAIANTLLLPRGVTPEHFASAGALGPKFKLAAGSVKHHFGIGHKTYGSAAYSGMSAMERIVAELSEVAELLESDASLRVMPAVDYKLPLLVLAVGLFVMLGVYWRITRQSRTT